MEFAGLQKLTLLDYPEKMACILFTRGCNFRCPYCHNAELVLGGGERFTEDEIISFLEKRRTLLDGVVVTGGEPLLHAKELLPFLQKVKKLGYSIKLDTNGAFPEALQTFIDAGVLDYIAMDIKNSREKYSLTTGTTVDVSAVERSVEIVKRFPSSEFRTTLVKPFFEEADLREIGTWIKGARHYFLQNFKDSGSLLGENQMSEYSKSEIEKFAAAAAESGVPVTVR